MAYGDMGRRTAINMVPQVFAANQRRQQMEAAAQMQAQQQAMAQQMQIQQQQAAAQAAQVAYERQMAMQEQKQVAEAPYRETPQQTTRRQAGLQEAIGERQESRLEKEYTFRGEEATKTREAQDVLEEKRAVRTSKLEDVKYQRKLKELDVKLNNEMKKLGKQQEFEKDEKAKDRLLTREKVNTEFRFKIMKENLSREQDKLFKEMEYKYKNESLQERKITHKINAIAKARKDISDKYSKLIANTFNPELKQDLDMMHKNEFAAVEAEINARYDALENPQAQTPMPQQPQPEDAQAQQMAIVDKIATDKGWDETMKNEFIRRLDAGDERSISEFNKYYGAKQ